MVMTVFVSVPYYRSAIYAPLLFFSNFGDINIVHIIYDPAKAISS